MASVHKWANQMTPEDKLFYRELGQRIARFRKAQNLTQTQLAEALGIAQQTLAHYEGGSLRVSVALLKAVAQTLKVSVEDLLDEPVPAAKRKRGPSSRLQQQIEQVEQLPRSKQKFVMEVLDTVIQRAS